MVKYLGLFNLTIFLISVVSQAQALSEKNLKTLREEFELRRDKQFSLLAGKPLVKEKKRPPLGPGRALYSRHYSYSIISFAMKTFWLNENEYFETANNALIENCEFYLDNPKAREDRDNLYWSADVLCRLVEFFGKKGSLCPGRLNTEAETIIVEMMWIYCKERSQLTGIPSAELEESKTWYIYESENHHIQLFSTLWHFLNLLKEYPLYRMRICDDGKSIVRHYEAWTAYAKEYLRQRGKKGLFVEIANSSYGAMTIKGIYNFYDFSPDPILKQRALYLLDLYWAAWAQEQLAGIRGGGKSRVYQGYHSQLGDINCWAGYYLGFQMAPPRNNAFTVLTSKYRMPLVVMDIALDTEGRGVYEIKQRRLGLAWGGYYGCPDYRLRTDFGGIYRYSYCCPDFIIGTLMFSELDFKKWTLISSQNRWQGVIFARHPNARIFPQCQTTKHRVTFLDQWSAQKKGTLITQKLMTGRDAGDMRVWFPRAGLSDPSEHKDIVVAESSGAYAAVRIVEGGYHWDEATQEEDGKWLRCKVDTTPVIIEVAQKEKYSDLDRFIESVLALPMKYSEKKQLIYTGLSGDKFKFYADYSHPPVINGKSVNYAPAKVFDSPFIQSHWDSGVVLITKGSRKLVLDFNTNQVLNPPR